MSNKFKIAKPGKSVDSQVLDDFYLHSDYPLLKVVQSGTFTTNNAGFLSINHNLGYRPFVLVFSQFVDTDGLGSAILSNEYYQHDWLIEGASVIFHGYTKIYDDRIEIFTGNSDVVTWAGGTDGIYYIFAEPIEP